MAIHRGDRAGDLGSAAFGQRTFLAINADDFYGASAFTSLTGFLAQGGADDYALVGYRLKRTLSRYGRVSRGICTVRDGRLAHVVERTGITRTTAGIVDDSGGPPRR